MEADVTLSGVPKTHEGLQQHGVVSFLAGSRQCVAGGACGRGRARLGGSKPSRQRKTWKWNGA